MSQNISHISAFNRWSYQQLEASLLPTCGSTLWKVSAYATQMFQFISLVPLAGISSVLIGLEQWIFPKPSMDSPLVAFAKHPPPWKETISLPNIPWGFATADFHENGPIVHKNTNFGKLYLQDYPKKFTPTDRFPNLWDHPEGFIERLEETGAKIFRFSIPRDLVEPEEGTFSKEAMQKIVHLCEMLQEKHIEPMITLEHNAHPLYQTFKTEEGIASFVRFAKVISKELYTAGVRKILTFNEIGVEPFQSYIMGAFPPYHCMDFEGAAQNFTNLMRTHTAVYRAVKQDFPDLEIGLSHDPIRFRHFHKMHPIWSPIERIVSKYLTDVNHTMVMTSLKTGNIVLKVPFFANYSVQLKEAPPIDFIGLQYYTDPCLKLSFFGGDSVTRVPNEKTTAYRYRQYPQGLASAVEEMSELKKPIEITEAGIDTGINYDDQDKERILFFGKIFQVVQMLVEMNQNVRSLILWTLNDNFDWHQGWDLPKECPIRFGFYKFDPKTGVLSPRPIVKWLKDLQHSK